MGLSGRKIKQRIPADPRNLTWADDAGKFGSNYLSKFGWDPSRGLGAAGDGPTSHIKVSQKLDMLGIGASHQTGPNAIAWKQNRDFESLLKRLNETIPPEKDDTPLNRTTSGGDVGRQSSDNENVNKKREQEPGSEGIGKAKKKRRKNVDEVAEKVASADVVKPYIPRHRAHRARAIASKSISSKSTTAISEILGIPPTPSASAAGSRSDTPPNLLKTMDQVTHEKPQLTMSTKYVTDYFKEKLLAKSSVRAETKTHLSPQAEDEAEDCDRVRGGLGSTRPGIPKSFLSITPPSHAPAHGLVCGSLPDPTIQTVEKPQKTASEESVPVDQLLDAQNKKKRQRKRKE